MSKHESPSMVLRRRLADLHPDRFQDAEERAKAEKFFKKVQRILEMEEGHARHVQSVPPGLSHEIHRQEPELFQYHREAHQQATPHLRTIYFALLDNPFIAFYNPMTTMSVPPPTVREAINKIDEINLRPLDRNIGNDLELGRGQIHWQRFIEIWKSIDFTSKDPHLDGEQRQGALMDELCKVCKEFRYPSGWASVPPNGQEGS